jgi:hypothetical protein
MDRGDLTGQQLNEHPNEQGDKNSPKADCRHYKNRIALECYWSWQLAN